MRDKKIEVLCNQNEYDKISEKAIKNNMSMSEYLRFSGINSKISCMIGLPNSIIAELQIIEGFKNRGFLTAEKAEIAIDRILKEKKEN